MQVTVKLFGDYFHSLRDMSDESVGKKENGSGLGFKNK